MASEIQEDDVWRASQGTLQDSKIMSDDGELAESDDENGGVVMASGVEMARDLDQMLETGFAEMIKSYDFSVLSSDEEKNDDDCDEAEIDDKGLIGKKEDMIPQGVYVFDDDDCKDISMG